MYNTDVVKEYHDKLLCGDSWAISRTLPDSIAQTIITSPPYFGHRTYSQSIDTQFLEFGCEEDPKEYVSKLAALFHELKRTLRDDGTFWLNLGDTYRDGQLLGIPWRTAIALQDSGWILRSEIIWNNRTPCLPLSKTDRP